MNIKKRNDKYRMFSLVIIMITIFASSFNNSNNLLFALQSNQNTTANSNNDNNNNIATIDVEQKVDFYLDYATFYRGVVNKSYVEIYIAVPMKSLTYNEDMRGSFSISVQVFDEENKIVAEDYWGQKVRVGSEEEKFSTSEFPAITKFSIKPGTYRLLVEVKDLTSGVSSEIDIPYSSGKFIVKDFYEKLYDDKEIAISSVQLCSKILRIKEIDKNEKSDFEKNGYDVLPNPRKLYGTFRPFMEYMVELYGLEKDKKYFLMWTIKGNDGKVILKSDYKEKKSPASTMALTGKAKIHSLKTGSYFFNLYLSNNPKALDEDDAIISTMNNFFIFRKIDFTKNQKNREVKEMINIDKESIEDYDFVITLNDKEIENEYEIVKETLLPEAEKKLSSQLNTDGKRNFLNRFWIEKEKKVQDSRKLFLAAVNYVNSRYSMGNKKGWQTDRGRVFLKVGKPDTDESILSNQSKFDHEIWRYFKENYIFVFLDKHGLNDFRVIHSNYEGEKFDPRWEDKIEKKLIGF